MLVGFSEFWGILRDLVCGHRIFERAVGTYYLLCALVGMCARDESLMVVRGVVEV